jgi:hypothetical protein
MTRKGFHYRIVVASRSLAVAASILALLSLSVHELHAGIFSRWWCAHHSDCHDGCHVPVVDDIEFSGEPGGTWYWLRTPDDEKRVIVSLYNRYCIRCHGVDGRGVWDIPDVPNFTNARWQACRSDGQLTRVILEGRGACMPPFRGTLTLEEACAMARYLRTFLPGTEMSRPDVSEPEPAPPPKKLPVPAK